MLCSIVNAVLSTHIGPNKLDFYLYSFILFVLFITVANKQPVALHKLSLLDKEP